MQNQVFSWVPKLARKCKIKHSFPCVVDGRCTVRDTKFSRMGRLSYRAIRPAFFRYRLNLLLTAPRAPMTIGISFTAQFNSLFKFILSIIIIIVIVIDIVIIIIFVGIIIIIIIIIIINIITISKFSNLIGYQLSNRIARVMPK